MEQQTNCLEKTIKLLSENLFSTCKISKKYCSFHICFFLYAELK